MNKDTHMNKDAVSPSRQYVALCRKINGGNKLIRFHLPELCHIFQGECPNNAGFAKHWFGNYGKDPAGEIMTYGSKAGQPAEYDVVLPLEEIVDFMLTLPAK